MRRHPSRVRVICGVLVLMITSTACGSATSPTEIAELEPTSPNDIALLLETTDRPVVLNVWASWCGPCRSEAPLLRRANEEFGTDVRFVGVDVRDSQDGARSFISEFGLDGFEHYFDATGSVPNALGGFGVPLTFFFHPGGELLRLHSGVIDERTLALLIDELLAS